MRDLGGKPLLAWTVQAARESALSRFVVSTEDPEIAAWCKRETVEWVPRPLEQALSSDMSAAVVLASLDFLRDAEGYEPDVVCLLHPTNPFRTGHHIDQCLRRILRCDWQGSVLCYTNDVENGAVLVKRTSDFRRDGSFMTGAPIWPYKMDERAGLDINTWDDLERARELLEVA